MKFSLVVCTINRVDELSRLLKSLDNQTYSKFEVIIIDQNEDDRLIPLIDQYSSTLDLRVFRSSPGLSRARNIGMQYVRGDIVCFPDDDCWYDPLVLERISTWLREDPKIDGIAGRSVDDQGREVNGRFSRKEVELNKENVWECGISYTIFLRQHVIAGVGGFDETLGVGSGTPWGSGEETDYLLRAIANGARVKYLPTLLVRHPDTRLQVAKQSLSRAYLYGCGAGLVLQRHDYHWSYKTRFIVRPLLGALLKSSQIKPGEALRHVCTAAGRIRGIVSRRL